MPGSYYTVVHITQLSPSFAFRYTPNHDIVRSKPNPGNLIIIVKGQDIIILFHHLFTYVLFSI